jgi:hypothetical protein
VKKQIFHRGLLKLVAGVALVRKAADGIKIGFLKPFGVKKKCLFEVVTN